MSNRYNTPQSTARTTARAAGVIALLAPLALGLSATGARAASSDFSNPSSDGMTVTDTTISATVQGCTPKLTSSCSATTLRLAGPGGASAQGSAPTSRSQYSVQATIPSGAPNGQWTATLSGGDTGSRTFATAFAPQTPTGFTTDTTADDPHDVNLHWNAGPESDVYAYRLYDQSGATKDVPVSVCTGSSCDYSRYFNNPKPGSYTYYFAVSALRNGACGGPSCGVEGPRTAARSATLTTPTPPPPSPTPAPSGGSGGTTGGTTSGGTTGGSTSGGSTGSGTTGGGGTSGGGSTGGTTSGTTVKPGPTPTLPALDSAALERRALALNFSAFAPGLGIPKLPPLPNGGDGSTAPQLAGEGPTPQGTYNPQLPYQAQTKTTKTTSIISDPIGQISSIDTEQLAKSLAIALIMVLMAAHLRRWIGSHVED